MSGPSDLARLTVTIDTANELFLSEVPEMIDVGGGVMRPTNAKVLADLASQMSGAQIYTSVALGLASTTSGGYFSVTASNNDEYIVLYRNDSGSASEIKRYPSTLAVDEINERISSSAAQGVELTDENGFGLARFAGNEASMAGLAVKVVDLNSIEFTDRNGFVIFRSDSSPSAIGGAGAFPLALGSQLRTQVMHIIGYGQSLARGVNSQPAISTTQPYGNLMIASGVKIRPGEPGYDASTFVPLIETTVGTEGESPTTGLCNGLVRRAIGDGEVQADWTFLGSSSGRSGKSIEQLSFGGEGDAERTVQLVKDCKAIARGQGKSYSVWAYAWDQGETNYIGSWTHSAYQYAQMELSLFDEMTNQVQAITQQKFRPYLFTYQVGAHRKYSVDEMSIALAQWRVSRDRADVVVAVPAYIMPVGSDLLHLTNEGSWLLGEYRSRAMYETMIRRNGKWRPLEPISVEWTDAYIDIRFHVPRGDLVLDSALAAAVPNFGFDVRESGSVVTDIISGVEVTAKDTVRIGLSRATTAAAVVSYARGRTGDPEASGPVTGARGNLRDTHGLFDTAVSPLGNTFALHNPCVMFQYDRKTGF